MMWMRDELGFVQMANIEIVEDLSLARALTPVWDELAVACSLPLCAPGWMLSWWQHAAPSDTALRIVAVHDGQDPLALAPWFVHTHGDKRIDMRFLGAEQSDRVDILCRAGHEREVAVALRRALAAVKPRPDLIAFEAAPIGSRWTRLLASGWSGRLRFARYRNAVYPAPVVRLPDSTPEEWLAGRSSNFRSQMGRLRRRLERRGGTVRQIRDPSARQDALGALLEMHADRWASRGESKLAKPGVEEMLREAAVVLGPERLRLWAVDIAGELISVQLFLAAGGEVKYWNGGWSEKHADLKPSMLTILAALQDAIARGERRLDLGAGSHPYKLRFANDQDALTWGGLVVRNRRWPHTKIELMPRVMRYRAKRLVLAMPAPIARRVEALVKARRARAS
jgi:CelD/BcsL family acetyltransferase involved in cellulose biosynthesis